jgi:hypothetical protein
LAVAAEGDGLFAGVESWDETGLAASRRIQISFLIGTDSSHPLRVRRDDERGAIHAFNGDRLTLTGSNVENIKPDALARFIS